MRRTVTGRSSPGDQRAATGAASAVAVGDVAEVVAATSRWVVVAPS